MKTHRAGGSRGYPRLQIEDFGRQLITTGDLDPIYIALQNVPWSAQQVDRWCVAYWCFYHAGVATYLSTLKGEAFWREMMVAARNEEPAPTGQRWARGSERRHFRGEQAIKATAELTERYADPADMVEYLRSWPGPGPVHYTDIAKRVKEHRGFGDWISFKVGDMLERCLRFPVEFDSGDVFMFADPTKAALKLFRARSSLPEDARLVDEQKAIRTVVDHLMKEFSDLSAPPCLSRPVRLQEVETVLCKWKSHMNGHYPLGNDIIEIREGLHPWVDLVPAAGQFRDAMPEDPR